MIVVAAWILHQVFLVILLGLVKWAGLGNLRGDGLFPRPRFFNFQLHGLGFFELLGAMGKDSGSILASMVVSLLIERSRIVHLEK